MNRAFALLLWLLVGIGPAFAGDDAVIEGTVQLPPPAMARMLNQRYVANADAVLTPTNPPAAVVYLEGNFSETEKPVSSTTVQMAQKNMLFAPDLVAIPIGGTVAFSNLDDTYHNVFSYSKTKRFDLGRYRKDEKPGTVVFDKPGVVTVHCEIHDRMRGTVLVLSTPYFVKTDSSGRYRIEHLPSGQFILKAWINDADVRQQSVELRSGAKFHIDFRKS
jgi:plastocyanin